MRRFRSTYPRPVLAALAIALTFYGVVWLASQHKLIYTDEIWFARDFALIAQGDWASLVIPHPPLYTALGGLTTRVFGYTLPTMRVMGGLSFVLALFLIPSACRALLQDPDRARRASIIGIVIYAIHPLALQGSLLLDIDNTIFTPAVLVFVIVLASSEGWSRGRRIAAVGLSFGLLLWTKLLPTSPLIAVSALLAYALRRKQFVDTALGILFGLLLFVASFGIAAILVNFPMDALAATFQRTQTPIEGGTQKLLSRVIMGGGITAVWLGIPFVAIYLGAVARHIQMRMRTRQFTALDSLVICSLAGLALYSAGNELPMGFPRYHYPLFALMVLLVSGYLADFEATAIRDRYALVAATAIGAAYFAFVIPDPLLPQYQLTFETNDPLQRLIFGLRLQVTALIIPFLTLWMGLWISLRNRSRAFLAACVAFCAASWSMLTIAQTRADYATIYEYGRVGGAAASAAIRARTATTDFLIAPMEILFAARRDGEFVLREVCPTCTAQAWLARFASRPPAAYVLTTKEDGRYTQVTRNPQVIALLDRCYDGRLTIGSYLVYFRTAAPCK